ncbi:hypothetical protein V1520DRAFT_322987 [Lipomyces starkeyi]|uniref:RRM domain-containing protein n=1 Tax=Lipomyces starkeyi NRRL Y-11557 TaxID=675824 RepID=A0A1E3QA01_LIPST|nr:hypothetical protein LIPSTDRAFT_69917 [Lipomyces starkeyi NRRL Y-11557]
MAPKKGTKMSLTDFLKDETYGSWADEMEDLPVSNAPPPAEKSFAGSSFDRSSDRYNDRGDRGDRYGSGDRFDRPPREFDDKVRGSRFEKYDPREEHGRDRPEREPLPIPDKPPYTAHIGNLSNEIVEDVLADYFSGLSIDGIRIMRDRLEQPKGFAYVEFKDRESLEQALDRTGGDLLGRAIRVNVADPPKDDRTQGDWRSGRTNERRVVSDGKVRDFDSWDRRGPLPPLASEENRRRRSSALSPSRSSSGSRSVRGQDDAPPDNQRSFDNWRSGAAFEGLRKSGTPSRSRDGSATPDSEDKPRPAERRRLNLKPRTQPIESETPAPAPVTSNKPNPFGGAAPVDTAKKLRELEDKMADKELERQRQRVPQEKERESSAKTGGSAPASRGSRRAPVTERRPRTNKETDEEKKEEGPATKQFDLLRKAATSDDFVPDEDDEDPANVVESDIKVAPAALEAAIAETAESASEAASTIAVAVEGDSEWSVVPKNKRATNGK